MKRFLSAILSLVILAAMPISANAASSTEEQPTFSALEDKALSYKLELENILENYEYATNTEPNGYEPSGAAVDTVPSDVINSMAVGDADNDQRITSNDALLILRTSIGLDSIPLTVSDIDNDSKITSIDALKVLRYSVGLKEDSKIGTMVDVEIIEPTRITISRTSASLEVGNSVKLNTTIYPSNTTYKNVTWTSSNNSVASVSSGVVTGIRVGTATITATTSNGKTATCKVTVSKPTTLTNCQRLINYINSNYTYIDKTSGYKGISITLDDIVENLEGSMQESVLYNHDNDTIIFFSEVTVYIGADKAVCDTTLTYNYKKDKVSQETVAWATTDERFKGTAEFKASTIKQEQVLNYKISDINRVSNSDAQNLSNIYRDVTLLYAELIIMSYTGLSFSDIGFTSY